MVWKDPYPTFEIIVCGSPDRRRRKFTTGLTSALAGERLRRDVFLTSPNLLPGPIQVVRGPFSSSKCLPGAIMKNRSLLIFPVVALLIAGKLPAQPASSAAAAATTDAHSVLAADYGKLPLSFEANQGQTDARVKYLSHGAGYSPFLTDSAAVLVFSKPDIRANTMRRPFSYENHPAQSDRTLISKGPVVTRPAGAQVFKTDVVRMKLEGTSPSVQIAGTEQLPGVANYFIGNDTTKWHSNVPTYAKVKYEGVYPGIDLVYYGNQRKLEYDFIVAPHADPKRIQLSFNGVQEFTITEDGDLRVIARNGELSFHKPAIYQVKEGRRQQIEQFPLTLQK